MVPGPRFCLRRVSIFDWRTTWYLALSPSSGLFLYFFFCFWLLFCFRFGNWSVLLVYAYLKVMLALGFFVRRQCRMFRDSAQFLAWNFCATLWTKNSWSWLLNVASSLSTSLARFVTHYVRTLLKPVAKFSCTQTHFNVNPFSKDFPCTLPFHSSPTGWSGLDWAGLGCLAAWLAGSAFHFQSAAAAAAAACIFSLLMPYGSHCSHRNTHKPVSPSELLYRPPLRHFGFVR